MPLLSDTMRTRIRHAAWGLLATSWNGGWSAIKGVIGIDTAGMLGANTDFRILNWKEMLAAYLGAFVIHAIIWFIQNPLPTTFDTPPPFTPAKPPESNP